MLSTPGQPFRLRVNCGVITERHTHPGSRSAPHYGGQCNDRSFSFG